MRRFNEVQCWVTTEVLLSLPAKRINTLKKFIKIAIQYVFAYISLQKLCSREFSAKENRDLMSLFAITLGLSNIAVSRLSSLWEVGAICLWSNQFNEFRKSPRNFVDSLQSSSRCWTLRGTIARTEHSWPNWQRPAFHSFLCFSRTWHSFTKATRPTTMDLSTLRRWFIILRSSFKVDRF